MPAGGDRRPVLLPTVDDPGAWPAVIITDTSGVVSYWNSAAEGLYGWSSHDTVGRSIMDINIEASDLDHAAGIMAQLATGRAWEGRFQVRRQDGTTFMAWVADAPLLDLDGAVVGVIGLSVPTTRASDEPSPPENHRDGMSQLTGTHRRPRPGNRLPVAVFGEADHRARLEAFVRANPERVELAETSPAVILLAAGDQLPYELADVPTLSRNPAGAPAVAAIASRPSDDVALECVRRDFRGYLGAELSDSDLLDAIEQAAAGHVALDAALSPEVGRRAELVRMAHPHIVNLWDLRPREMEALTYLASGLSNRDIARRMIVGEETVKSHLKAVYRKLGVRDRTAAVATALGHPVSESR